MLYDPARWAPEPSTADLIAWLETQDPKKTYRWWDVNNCLLARYLGHQAPYQLTRSQVKIIFPHLFVRCNYGAALKRARALLTTETTDTP